MPPLQELVDEFDPGPQPQLTEGLPPWMFAMIGLSPTPTEPPEELLRRSADAQMQADALAESGIADNLEIVQAIRLTARAVVLAEQAAAAGSDDPSTLARLERVYAAVDVPLLAGDRNAFAQFITLFAQVAAAEGAGPSDGGQLQQLAGVVQQAVRAAGPLHRHTTAALVRADPEHAGVPTALLTVAKARRGTGDKLAVQLAKAAIARRGDAATPDEQLDLARVCYDALDLACGDAAVAAGASAKDADALKKDGILARRIVELADANDFDGKLERAQAQLKLGRWTAAEADFKALRAAAPNDARPVTGLAKLAIETEIDFIGASKIVDDAGTLQNADEDFYEIAIGTRATAALAELIPQAIASDPRTMGALLTPLFERTQLDAAAYAALGNDDGAFLVLVLDVGKTLLDQYVAGTAPSLRSVPALTQRIMQLQGKLPEHGHSYRLRMSAALFEADRATALAAVDAPASGPEAETLAIRHARALCDLAVTWSDPKLATRCFDAVTALPASASQQQLLGDALVTSAQLTDSASWPGVAKALEPLLDDDMTPEDARTLNNMGMALWRMGNKETAINAWTLSAQLAQEYGGVPQLNLIAAQADTNPTQASAAMRGLTSEDRQAGVRITALAWLHAWASGKKAKAAAKATLTDTIAAEAKAGARPTLPDPYGGLLLQGSLQASFSYTARKGLDIQLDASGLPWAVMAPPR